MTSPAPPLTRVTGSPAPFEIPRLGPRGAKGVDVKTVVGWLALFVPALAFSIYNSPDLQHAIGAGATSIVRPIVIPLVELINVPAFVYVAATIILVAGIGACVAYWVRSVRPRLRVLKAIRAGIGTLPLPSRNEDTSGWPAASHRLGQLLMSNGMFVFAWSAYQAESARHRAVPSVPFSNYIATEPEGTRNHSVLMGALPGYFTSLGLIMTFLGLVVALYFAAKGFRTGNIEDARAAIIQLLNAASFKFLTSVAALISAFTISVFLRLSLSLLGAESLKTAERIEVFLATWREHVGAGEVEPPLAAADLSSQLATLSNTVEALAATMRAFSVRVEATLRDRVDATGG